MKTIKKRKITAAIFAILVLLVSPPSTFAYPPDNAAVLYYQACMLYEVDSKMNGVLKDLCSGRIEPNEEIIEFLQKKRRVIDFVLDASEVRHCDWGVDYSKGCDALMPPFYKFRQLSYLIVADARVAAQQGDYKTALGRCTSLYRMARHVNERTLISYLVGAALHAVANESVIEILSDMPEDMETLTWLKNQFVLIDKLPFSVKPALRFEHKAGIISISPDRITHIVQGFGDGALKEKILERILAADEPFFDRNREYWSKYMDAVQAAFDLPYPEAYSKLKVLSEKPSKEFSKNPNATLAASLASGWHVVCSRSIRSGTDSNALKTAIEIYLIKARTGKLPDALPAGLPGDLFSGKAFQYEKTTEGFILRCQGKDLSKDEIYQYEFKVKK